jgi:hypothetical protein
MIGNVIQRICGNSASIATAFVVSFHECLFVFFSSDFRSPQQMGSICRKKLTCSGDQFGLTELRAMVQLHPGSYS